VEARELPLFQRGAILQEMVATVRAAGRRDRIVGHVVVAQRFGVEADMLEHFRAQRLFVHSPLRMKEDVEVDALIVVDRHDAHPQVLVWIGDEEWRGDRRYAHMHILPGRLAASQRRVVKSEIRVVDLDARTGVKGHVGGGGEVEILEFARCPETIHV